MPITANYYVTLRCNQRCIFCNIPHTNNGSPSREPTMEQVRSNLRDLKRLGVMVLDVTGGEPFLYRNLVEMVEAAHKIGFFTTITTNGMLYPKYAKALAGKVKALLFSIDSTDPDEHDRIRAMKSFHLVVEALAAARRLKQTFYISHVVTNESYDKVEEMIRFSKDQGAILYLNPCFSFFGNEGLDADKAKGLEKYFGRPGVILDPAQLALIASGGNKTDDPVCRAVSSSKTVISPENELVVAVLSLSQARHPHQRRPLRALQAIARRPGREKNGGPALLLRGLHRLLLYAELSSMEVSSEELDDGGGLRSRATSPAGPLCRQPGEPRSGGFNAETLSAVGRRREVAGWGFPRAAGARMKSRSCA